MACLATNMHLHNTHQIILQNGDAIINIGNLAVAAGAALETTDAAKGAPKLLSKNSILTPMSSDR